MLNKVEIHLLLNKTFLILAISRFFASFFFAEAESHKFSDYEFLKIHF